MAKIRISLNEVVRDFIGQMIYTYDKYIQQTDLTHTEITDFNFEKHFEFESLNHMNKFIYSEASLELFGHADVTDKNVGNSLNEFILDMIDEGHTIEIVSREVDKAIPSTLFFLSKIICKSPNINFVKDNIDEWGDADILITANPVALANKPEGKISVMIKAPYNSESDADLVLGSVMELFNREENKDKTFKLLGC